MAEPEPMSPHRTDVEDGRTLEFVFGRLGRGYWMSKQDSRVVRGIAAGTMLLVVVVGTVLKFLTLWLFLFGIVTIFVLGVVVVWAYLEAAGVPTADASLRPEPQPFRLDPDTMVWAFCYFLPGAFGLVVLVWLGVIVVQLVDHAFEPKLLIVLWMFLAPLLALLLVGRYVRRKFLKQD